MSLLANSLLSSGDQVANASTVLPWLIRCRGFPTRADGPSCATKCCLPSMATGDTQHRCKKTCTIATPMSNNSPSPYCGAVDGVGCPFSDTRCYGNTQRLKTAAHLAHVRACSWKNLDALNRAAVRSSTITSTANPTTPSITSSPKMNE